MTIDKKKKKKKYLGDALNCRLAIKFRENYVHDFLKNKYIGDALNNKYFTHPKRGRETCCIQCQWCILSPILHIILLFLSDRNEREQYIYIFYFSCSGNSRPLYHKCLRSPWDVCLQKTDKNNTKDFVSLNFKIRWCILPEGQVDIQGC